MKYLLFLVVFLVSCRSCPKAPKSCYLQPRTIYQTCFDGGEFEGLESYSSTQVYNVCCTEDKQ